jgi:hypothetical protein
MSGIMQLLLAARVAAGAFTEYKIFTASGNWTAPTGVTEVEYLVVAGGGAGGVGGFFFALGAAALFSVAAAASSSISASSSFLG